MMMRFGETFYLNEQEALINRAGEQAEKICLEEAIKVEDFVGLYGQNNIATDKNLVDRLEVKFTLQNGTDKQGQKLAKILEAIVHQHSELSNWFGPNANAIKTSRYDDYVNGVDEIIEFREPEKPYSHLALAIDTTTNPERLAGQIEKILANIEKGKLTQIKYFESSDGTYRGQLDYVPLSLVGVENKTITDLAEIWTSEARRLADHPIQNQILEQVLEQLILWKQFADKVGQTKLAQRCEQSIKIIKPIFEQKNDGSRRASSRDGVHQELIYQLDQARRNI